MFSAAARLTGSTPGPVINQDLTTDTTAPVTAISAVTRDISDGGGDGPENGINRIELSAENLARRKKAA